MGCPTATEGLPCSVTSVFWFSPAWPQSSPPAEAALGSIRTATSSSRRTSLSHQWWSLPLWWWCQCSTSRSPVSFGKVATPTGCTATATTAARSWSVGISCRSSSRRSTSTTWMHGRTPATGPSASPSADLRRSVKNRPLEGGFLYRQ